MNLEGNKRSVHSTDILWFHIYRKEPSGPSGCVPISERPWANTISLQTPGSPFLLFRQWLKGRPWHLRLELRPHFCMGVSENGLGLTSLLLLEGCGGAECRRAYSLRPSCPGSNAGPAGCCLYDLGEVTWTPPLSVIICEFRSNGTS